MSKKQVKWVDYPYEECPKCESTDAEVLTRSTKDNYIYDGEAARCKKCAHIGLVNVEDSECADIIWDEVDEPNNG